MRNTLGHTKVVAIFYVYNFYIFDMFYRKDMIERLWRVFGVDYGEDYGEDPDASYVLTSDNFLKMIAIHMRFRYNDNIRTCVSTKCHCV